ncbi:fungal specific transcription factordomain-containing protein [Cordyceps javanica]|uniref:Fungal specific transcription factordomain-containing protein n=1 Tax=Cordyceps javanica TaxID=43265 RepID=A0A545V5H2_9HYPO|nr:fungal specific transcription factordomain-containing protein [Cordyceps javanica]
MESTQIAPQATSSVRRQALNVALAADLSENRLVTLAVNARPNATRLSPHASAVRGSQYPADTMTRLDRGSPSFGMPSAPLGSPLDAPTSVTSAHYPALDMERVQDELSLTQRHSTAPQHLLLWPCSPLKLGRVELQYPMDMEIKRAKLPLTTKPPRFLQPLLANQSPWIATLSLGQLTVLTEAYFSHFHPVCLVLDEVHFYSTHLSNAVKHGFSTSLDSSIVLLVCSLGAVAAHYNGKEEWAGEDPSEVGLGFFNLALDMFRHAGGADWTSVQCLLLMGLFHSSNLNVFDAWQSIHKACSVMLILVPLQTQLEPHQCELFWIGYLHESQILAEFDFPASGLGKLEGAIPLPLKPGAGQDAQHARYSFFFLSLITMRLLLNRTIYHLYSKEKNRDNMVSDAAPSFRSPPRSVVRELDRQLEEWRSCLPDDFKFESFDNTPNSVFTLGDMQSWSTMDRLRGSLMARYFAAKSIIHRSCLYRTLHGEEHSLRTDGGDDERGARVALGAARLSTLCSGILHQPLPLLLHPINSWRRYERFLNTGAFRIN